MPAGQLRDKVSQIFITRTPYWYFYIRARDRSDNTFARDKGDGKHTTPRPLQLSTALVAAWSPSVIAQEWMPRMFVSILAYNVYCA